jgi:hypothetical protein
MRMKSARALTGLATIAVAIACGGRFGSDVPRADTADSGVVGTGRSGSASPASSDGNAGSAPTAGALSSGSVPTGTPGDGGCPAESWLPSPAFATCWDCSARSCESQLVACAADCNCSQALSKAITCENGTASLVELQDDSSVEWLLSVLRSRGFGNPRERTRAPGRRRAARRLACAHVRSRPARRVCRRSGSPRGSAARPPPCGRPRVGDRLSHRRRLFVLVRRACVYFVSERRTVARV